MKKLAVILVLALLLPVFAGCKSAKNANVSVNGTNASAEKLSAQEAKAIALAHAGFTSDQVWDLDVELEQDWNEKAHYEINFEKDNWEYEYEVDAYTGDILRNHKEQD